MTRTLVLVGLALLLAAPAGATTRTGLYGTVMRGPTRPVCSVEEACSEPAAGVTLMFLRGGLTAAKAVTDANGHYRVRLPTGVYTIRVGPRTSLGNRIEPSTARVRAAWRRQNFDIDTGIR
jgi:hypothetical protein